MLLKLRENWFLWAALPVLLAVEAAFTQSVSWNEMPHGEWVVLFDLCVFVPALFLFAYRHTLPIKPRLIRALGLAGLGLLLARFLVPEPSQNVLPFLSDVRNSFLVFVVIFEVWVITQILRAVYARNADAQRLERDFGMPLWIAKLMVLEAKFWKAVWRIFRR